MQNAEESGAAIRHMHKLFGGNPALVHSIPNTREPGVYSIWAHLTVGLDKAVCVYFGSTKRSLYNRIKEHVYSAVGGVIYQLEHGTIAMTDMTPVPRALVFAQWSVLCSTTTNGLLARALEMIALYAFDFPMNSADNSPLRPIEAFSRNAIDLSENLYVNDLQTHETESFSSLQEAIEQVRQDLQVVQLNMQRLS